MTSTSSGKIFEDFSPHLLLIFSQFIFSFYHIIGYLAQKNASLLVLSLYRTAFSSVLMLLFTLTRRKGNYNLGINKEDYLRFMYIGFCNVVNVLGTLLAFQYITPNRYAIMQPLVPILATLLSCIVQIEKLNFLKGIGVCVAVLGSIMIASETSTEQTPSRPAKDRSNLRLGTLIVFFQCFFSANLIVFQKTLLERYDSDVVTLVYISLTTVYVAVVCLIFFNSLSSSDFIFNNERLTWLYLAYSIIFVTFFASNVTSWAGKRLVPSVSSVYITLQPVGTLLLSWILLDYAPTSDEVLGGIVVCTGLIITLYGRCEEEGQNFSATSVYTEAIARTNSVSTVPTVQAIDIEYQEWIDHKGEEIYCQEESESEGCSLSPPVAHLVSETVWS